MNDIDFYVYEDNLFYRLKWTGDNIEEIQQVLNKYNEEHKNHLLFLNVVEDCLYIFTGPTYSRCYFPFNEDEEYIKIYPYRTNDPLGFNDICEGEEENLYMTSVSRNFNED